jgi:hypothetical protein
MVATLEYRKVCLRPHASLKTVQHISNIGWTVVTLPPYSPDLAPSDFHHFGPMKCGLCGQHFPLYFAFLRAVKQWASSAGADFYEHGMQALVHRCRRCTPMVATMPKNSVLYLRICSIKQCYCAICIYCSFHGNK